MDEPLNEFVIDDVAMAVPVVDEPPSEKYVKDFQTLARTTEFGNDILSVAYRHCPYADKKKDLAEILIAERNLDTIGAVLDPDFKPTVDTARRLFTRVLQDGVCAWLLSLLSVDECGGPDASQLFYLFSRHIHAFEPELFTVMHASGRFDLDLVALTLLARPGAKSSKKVTLKSFVKGLSGNFIGSERVNDLLFAFFLDHEDYSSIGLIANRISDATIDTWLLTANVKEERFEIACIALGVQCLVRQFRIFPHLWQRLTSDNELLKLKHPPILCHILCAMALKYGDIACVQRCLKSSPKELKIEECPVCLEKPKEAIHYRCVKTSPNGTRCTKTRPDGSTEFVVNSHIVCIHCFEKLENHVCPQCRNGEFYLVYCPIEEEEPAPKKLKTK